MTKYRLLIVDDEEIIRKGLSARVAYFGFPDLTVAEAASGREALAAFREGAVDIALVDIAMPDMNGLDLIEQARALQPRTRFVLLSGFAEFSYAQRAIVLGVRAYLNKPVSNEVLRAQLDELLAELRGETPEAETADASALERELNQLLSGAGADARPHSAFPALYQRFPQIFDGGGWLYLGVVHIGARTEGDEAPSGEQLSAARGIVRDALTETPCACERLVADSEENPRRMYALFMDGDGSRLRQQLEQAFLTVQRNFERRASARATLGVSRLSRVLTPECMSNARAALRQRLIYGRSNIYFFEDISSYQNQPFPEAELELLRKNMVRGDRDGVRRQLELLFSKKRMESCKAVVLHVLWVRVLSLMMSAFNGMDADTMNRLLTQISRSETIASRDEIISTLTQLTDLCLRGGSGREMSGAGKIGYALDYIREHFNEEIVINDLAARLGMSPGYFSSMFKKEVRQSTMQYITGLRMERAKRDLATTGLSIAVIAKNVGYEDSQYFFRVFKKTTGMTPLQYRQAMAGGEE